MASSEAMTSSTHSFAYSYGLVKKCFLKICETSKFHNFLIFQPIFIRFSLFCSENFTLSSEIKLDQLRTSPLILFCYGKQSTQTVYKISYRSALYYMLINFCNFHAVIKTTEKKSTKDKISISVYSSHFKSSELSKMYKYGELLLVYHTWVL